MKNYRQFILSRIAPDANGKDTKIPCDTRGYPIDSQDPKNWMDYETCMQQAAVHGYKPAFVLTADDPYFCIDIDNCVLPDYSGWSALANQICYDFSGAFIEVSQSGTGLHIWGSYTHISDHMSKNVKERLELYHEKRFIILGSNATGDPDKDCTLALNNFIAEYMERKGGQTEASEWTTVPVPEWGGYEDDKELIENAMTHKPLGSVFKDDYVSFRDLWENNEEQLAKQWPSENDAYDRSSADMSLAQRLAYYTGKNCQRVYDLMRQSALVRDKWENRPDYLTRTVLNACSQQTRIHTSSKPTSKGGLERKLAGGFVGADEIPELFEGCTYILRDHAVFTRDRGLIGPEQFKAAYGGYKITIDDGKTTRHAFEAFTQCPTWRPPEASAMTFRPDLEPLCLIEEGNQTYLNTYRPVMVSSVPGDVSRFLKLLQVNFPDDHDRAIILNYMAALVQHIGRKFQWAPLLQGPEGNGKTFLLRVIENAIGSEYTHTVNAQDLAGNGGKFNGWLFAKLFVSIEEIRVGNKFEIMEILKPLITNEKIEVQRKGKDQITTMNFANFIFTSNYMDALALNDDQRRFCPLMSAPQTREQIHEMGLTTDFFVDLWDWARGTGDYAGQTPGYHHITHYLKTYDIQEAYNPAKGCVRAPRSTHYQRFAAYSLGRIEQEILEAVENGRIGFRGGFISSTMLDNLLKEMRAASKISHPKRRELLHHLGYTPHPHLPDGRTTTTVLPDGNRPKLYVKQGSIYSNVTEPKEIARLYVQAQKVGDAYQESEVVPLQR